MYLSTVTATFSSAHFLREYAGKCEKLHGHNWRVEVTVATEELDKAGMGLDFTILRRKAGEFLSDLDHAVLNELPPFLEQNPSAENLARHIFTGLRDDLEDDRVRLWKVKVWESDTSWAEYRP